MAPLLMFLASGAALGAAVWWTGRSRRRRAAELGAEADPSRRRYTYAELVRACQDAKEHERRHGTLARELEDLAGMMVASRDGDRFVLPVEFVRQRCPSIAYLSTFEGPDHSVPRLLSERVLLTPEENELDFEPRARVLRRRAMACVAELLLQAARGDRVPFRIVLEFDVAKRREPSAP